VNETSEFYCERKDNNDNRHINGVLDVSACIDESPPVFLSHPHFMEGDDELFEHFEGLQPNRSLHDSFVFVHKRLAVPIHGVSRMQINLKLTRHRSYYKSLPDDLILPLAWLEISNDKLGQQFEMKLFLSTTVADWIERFLQYGSLVFLMLWFPYLIIFKIRIITFVTTDSK